MANHRPKSLNELNHVYDKAMKAERAIKEGSSRLQHSEKPVRPDAVSDSIFQQLQQQAPQTKTEIHDPDIANIASDFMKRFAEQDKPKAKPAPTKEVKRPAPSIQALYHTPVKSEPQATQDAPLQAEPAPVQQPARRRPAKPQPRADVTPTAEQADIEKAQQAAYRAPHIVSSSVRVTSTERSDLMNEYMRVMSDEDDDFTPSKKPKMSFFKRRNKRAQIQEDTTEPMEQPYEQEPVPDEIPVVAFDDSDVQYTPDYSEDIENEEPMSLYEYIEADFDFEEDDAEAALDMTYDPQETAQDSYAEEAADDTPDEILQEAQEEFYEEADVTAQLPEADEQEIEADEIQDIPSDEPEQELSQEITEISAEDEITVEDNAEEVEESDTGLYDESQSEEEASVEDPTAGMVFDDVFSVSDVNKRSYTGGNWTEVFGDDPDFMASLERVEEDYYEEEGYSQQYDEEYEEEAYEEPKKKKGLGLKIFLSLVLVFLVTCAAGVGTLAGFAGINTGKLILDDYRVFTAKQDFPFSGIKAGDLIITENYYAEPDDTFVYVSHESQSFMVGKHSGSTTNSDGDVLFIAENEAGRVLVHRDDSMGIVVDVYNDIGAVVGPVSEYYIFIIAAILVLCIVILLAIVLPSGKNKPKKIKSKKSKKHTESSQQDELSAETELVADDYQELSDDEAYGEGEYVSYEADADEEENLFSSI